MPLQRSSWAWRQPGGSLAGAERRFIATGGRAAGSGATAAGCVATGAAATDRGAGCIDGGEEAQPPMKTAATTARRQRTRSIFLPLPRYPSANTARVSPMLRPNVPRREV
jgi:hypothetical protein